MRTTFLDSKLMRIINLITDYVILSVLWCVCSVPIVTIGLASATTYHTFFKCISNSDNSLFHTFFKSIKQNIRIALPIGTVLVTMTFFCCWLMRSLIHNTENINFTLGIMNIFVIGFLVIVQIIIYPLVGYFELNFKQVLMVTTLIIFGNPIKCSMLFLILIVCMLIVYCYPPLLLIIPGIYIKVSSPIYMPLFYKYIRVKNREKFN